MTPGAHDRELIRGAFARRAVVFAPGDEAVVQAETIRCLLLGQVPGGVAVEGEAPSHVSLSGARIAGSLDLRNLQRPDGSALPSLELLACRFDEPIRLAHASMRRLSLAGSRFPLLEGPEIRLDGSIDLSGVAPPEDGGTCRVDLRGARIAGDVVASRATLRAPVRPSGERDADSGDSWPALDLRLSRIEGEVVLQPGFRAAGGLHLRDARVDGSVWAAGARLEEGEAFALNAYGFGAGNGVFLTAGIGADGLPAPFTALGHLHMPGTRIHGTLDLSGARLVPPRAGAGDPHGSDAAQDDDSAPAWSGLLLEGARIDGNVLMSVESVDGPDGPVGIATDVEGMLWLDAAVIGGRLDLSGGSFSDGVTAMGSRIGGDFLLSEQDDRAPACGDVNLQDAEIGASVAVAGRTGAFDVSRSRIGGHLRVSGRARGLAAVDANIDGDAVLAIAGPPTDEPPTDDPPAPVSFLDAVIGGVVDLSGRLGPCNFGRARIGKSMGVRGEAGDVWLRDASVGGALVITGGIGDVDLEQAEIATHLEVAGHAGDISLKDASVGGDLWVKADASVGSLTLNDTSLGGTLGLFGTIGVPMSDRRAIFGIGLRTGRGVEVGDATFHGSVYLRDAEVRQTVQVRHTNVLGEFDAPRIRVGGDIELTTVRFENRLRLRQAQVGGHLRLAHVDVAWDGDWRAPAVVDLEDARVGSEITIEGTPAAEHRHSADSAAGIAAVRSSAVSFYPGWRLVEAVVDEDGVAQLGDAAARALGRPGVVGFLWRRTWFEERGEAILLTGNSVPIHELNQRAGLGFRIDDAGEAVRYVEFFTSYVWGDDGAFRIVRPGDPRLDRLELADDDEEDAGTGDDGPAVAAPVVTETSDEGGRTTWVVRCSMLYGTGLFTADLAVRSDGTVSMLNEALRGRLAGPARDAWISPFRFAAELDADTGAESRRGDPFPPGFKPPGAWRRERGRRRRRILADLKAVLRRPPTEVWLEDAHAERLDDQDGRGWAGAPRLRLDGFTYERAHTRLDRERDPLGRSGEADRLRRLRREGALYGCRRLRRRPLACNPGWWVVEADTAFQLDGGDAYRRGVAAWLWSGAPENRAAVLPLVDDETGRARLEGWLRTTADSRQLETPEAAVDYARIVGFQHFGDRFLDADHPAAAGSGAGPAEARRALPGAGGAFRGWEVTATTLSADGIRLRRFEIDEDGGVERLEAEGAEAEVRSEGGAAAPPEVYAGLFRTSGGASFASPGDFAHSPWNGPDWADLETGAEAGLVLRDCVAAARHWLDRDLAEPRADSGARRPAAARIRRIVRSLHPASVWRRARQALGEADGRAASRLRWLRLQYPDGVATVDSWHAHPYEVLASALRNEGEERAARKILSEKLRMETRIERWRRKPGRKLFNMFFGAFFDFGLSSGRALLATAGLLALGWFGVAWLNDVGLLVVDFTPSATMVVDMPPGATGGAPTREMALAVAEPGRAEARVPCGDNISSLVFAADYMVPVLEFGQRHRCQVAGSRPPGLDGWWLSPGLWQVALTLYSVLGAIFVSIALLTVSGVLRRHAES